MLVPSLLLRKGSSCTVAIFLALLKLHFGCCELLEDVAVTGTLSLSGYVIEVIRVKVKAREVRKQGVSVVVAPWDNRYEADQEPCALPCLGEGEVCQDCGRCPGAYGHKGE